MFPELLAPVGNEEMCHAAVQNGADAIYVGIPGFNARNRESRGVMHYALTFADIKNITYYCRLYGVKVYFACNILVSDEELANFEAVIEPYLELCPDAVIVQDIGLVRWFREVAPWLPIHASTQMTIASTAAVQMAKEMGISRCVLARELSIEQIKSIRKNCPDMELEVFVHGALCLSYSGQCFASEYFGGRSANRGQCAQPCRLPYKFVIDGKVQESAKQYLLSTNDLCALPVLDELIACKIDSLKIEGRLKSPEYVASTVAAYRKKANSMEGVFSRGFTTGWLGKQCVVSGETSG
ncbi:MAG: U32 family peptidase, partial [Fibromonadales bacterium]|nr:U32 family peptidase [Fibromonadales bacterium]